MARKRNLAAQPPQEAPILSRGAVLPAAGSNGNGAAHPTHPPGIDAPVDPTAQRPVFPGRSVKYDLGPRVRQAFEIEAYARNPGDPAHRTFRIFALDPSYRSIDGAVATVKVPYEPIQESDNGLRGRVIEVDASVVEADGARRPITHSFRPNGPKMLLDGGLNPSLSDERFHQQNVYAIGMLVYTTFRRALGREIGWSFSGGDPKRSKRLRLRPFGATASNAWYDKSGEVVFGRYCAPAASAQDGQAAAARRTPDGFTVFTSLCHDVVAHEVTHAILDGLRSRLTYPSSHDALAFHEGFADVVAIFHRFRYRPVVERGIVSAVSSLNAALACERGSCDPEDVRLRGLMGARSLHELARQFGETSGNGGATRSAALTKSYDELSTEPHERGAILFAAAYEAFSSVYVRRIRDIVRAATEDRGVIPEGSEIPTALLKLLTDQAIKVANQFLEMTIRAVDYCPPIDLHLGEFLRAVVTSDRDLVPDDPWGYRDAWIEAFRRRRIIPPGITQFSEDDLVWKPPREPLGRAKRLTFSRARFDREPGRPARPKEVERQACELGEFATETDRAMKEFGLSAPKRERDGSGVGLPIVESIRSCRRVGPDRQILFDTVAEIIQRVDVLHEGSLVPVYGGATIIVGPRGEIRYVIGKRRPDVENRDPSRVKAQAEFMSSDVGRRFWNRAGSGWTPARDIHFRLDAPPVREPKA